MGKTPRPCVVLWMLYNLYRHPISFTIFRLHVTLQSVLRLQLNNAHQVLCSQHKQQCWHLQPHYLQAHNPSPRTEFMQDSMHPKRGCGSDIWCSMNKFWEHSAWTLPVTSGQIWQDSINTRSLELANTVEQDQRTSAVQGEGDGKQLFNGCSISLGGDNEKFWKCISVTT